MTSSRRYFREPIPEIFLGAQLLEKATLKHLGGDKKGAAELFREADMPIIREWVESILGKKSSYIHFSGYNPLYPIFTKSKRIPLRMPNSIEKQRIHTRDGYHCRFCGIPVIRAEVRKKMIQSYPNDIPWGKSNISRHACFFALWAQYDHIMPHARGGDNSIENMILTCCACNYGRMSYLLDEVGLLDPLSSPFTKDEAWDGLESFV